MQRTIALALLTSCLLACGKPTEETALRPAASPAPKAQSHQGFPFTDVTASTGVDFVHENGAAGARRFPETMGPGLALFDADGDGDLDLYAVNGAPWPGDPASDPAPANRLYLNRGTGGDTEGDIAFEDATAASGTGDRGYGMGAAVGDYDGDGHLDLYVANYGPNVLFRNRGDGRFETVDAGAADPSWSVGAAFLDYDGDGDLDLYVVNYLDYDAARAEPCKAGPLTIYCSPERFPPAPDRLYRNDGGRFSDVARQAGIAPDGKGMGLAAGDLDGDGDPDLVVANDRSQNQLYRNDGGRFEEVGAEAGIGYGETGQLEGGMGVVLGDFTGSGRVALFQTNFQKEPNRFFAAGGAPGLGFFSDLSLQSGLGFPSYEMVSWGIGDLDVEGDGDLDLAVANGHVYDNAAEFVAGSSYAMRDQLFTNDGQGRFKTEGFPGPPLSSRGVASGDLDGDGDEDLVVASCAGPLRIWRNDAGRAERFVVLELVGRAPNTGAVGARVTAHAGEGRLRREVAGGGSYASHSDTRIYFGLGDADRIDRLEVRWPDGSSESAATTRDGQILAPGRSYVWRQGEGIVVWGGPRGGDRGIGE